MKVSTDEEFFVKLILTTILNDNYLTNHTNTFRKCAILKILLTIPCLSFCVQIIQPF